MKNYNWTTKRHRAQLRMCIAALFRIAKMPFRAEWINKLCAFRQWNIIWY